MAFTLTGKRKLLLAGALAGFLVYAWLSPKFLGTSQLENPSKSPSSESQQMELELGNNEAKDLNNGSDSSLNLSSVRPVAAHDLIQWLPQLKNQPGIIAFKSKYCHDCQQLAPILESLVAEHPHMAYIPIDVQRDKASYGAIIRAFHPAVVPVTVFVQSGGHVTASVTGYQSADTLAPFVTALTSTN